MQGPSATEILFLFPPFVPSADILSSHTKSWDIKEQVLLGSCPPRLGGYSGEVIDWVVVREHMITSPT